MKNELCFHIAHERMVQVNEKHFLGRKIKTFREDYDCSYPYELLAKEYSNVRARNKPIPKSAPAKGKPPTSKQTKGKKRSRSAAKKPTKTPAFSLDSSDEEAEDDE